MRTTRSGLAFSPYYDTDAVIEPIRVPIDFALLLEEAIDVEMAAALADGEDAEPIDDIDVQPQATATPNPLKRPASPIGNAPKSKNAHRHQKRRVQREQDILEQGHHLNQRGLHNLLPRVAPIPIPYSAESFPAAKNAYTAKPGKISDYQHEYTPQELDAMGFRCVEYEPGKIRPVIDVKERVISCFIDKPQRDPTWDASCMSAYDAMQRECEGAGLKSKPHRRGRHPVINTGALMGLGQTHPMLLKLGSCEPLVHRLVGDNNFKRMAAFASASFNLWAPRLHEYYRKEFDKVTEHSPDVTRNFDKSVFPTACFNMGGDAIAWKHRDTLNVPFGWCPITAIGIFDHRKGAHIVLWDLKLYFEFPHGCTIFVPSASCVHSNTPLANPATERRSSFTQYFPGAILRWLDNGYMTDRELKQRSEWKFKELAAMKAARWQKGLSMFSTIHEVMNGITRSSTNTS